MGVLSFMWQPDGRRRKVSGQAVYAVYRAVYEKVRKHIYVGYLFVGDRRNDAAALSLADSDDGTV